MTTIRLYAKYKHGKTWKLLEEFNNMQDAKTAKQFLEEIDQKAQGQTKYLLTDRLIRT